MDRMTMKIDGMSCGHCVSAVTKALETLPDVQVEQVKVGSATVAFDPATTTESRIAEAVETKGYRVAATTR
jgi:copper chaperone